MSVCRRGIDLLGTMNIGLNILQDIQSSFFRTFIHLPGKKQGDIAAAEQFLKAIEHICEVCEVPTLEKYGIPGEEFYAAIPKMAQDALDSGSPGNTRKVPTFEDCQEIYKAAYS